MRKRSTVLMNRVAAIFGYILKPIGKKTSLCCVFSQLCMMSVKISTVSTSRWKKSSGVMPQSICGSRSSCGNSCSDWPKSAGKNINTMQTRHPAVTLSMEYIENNLSQFLPTKNVLKAVGLSHNHLNRLFSAGLGKTIREYILERRMVKAAYFLTSTRIPVKCAAIECGLPNLQHFNKIIHRYFGMAPTQLRRKAALETEKTS